jgi:Ankyrin repeat
LNRPLQFADLLLDMLRPADGFALFSELVRRNPDLPLRRERGTTLLHLALFKRCKPLELIQLLCRDEILMRQDRMGRTPLHWACVSGPQAPGVCQLILEECPAAVLKIKDVDDALPLHLASTLLRLRNDDDDLVINGYMNQLEDNNIENHDDRMRPMIEVEFVRRILNLYPDALLARRPDGSTLVMKALRSALFRYDVPELPDNDGVGDAELQQQHQRHASLMQQHAIHMGDYCRSVRQLVDDMIDRAPHAVSAVTLAGSETSTTRSVSGLYNHCMNAFPDPHLVTKLIRVDPLALLLRGGTKGCVPYEALCRRDGGPDQYRAHRPQYPHDPYDEPLASQVVSETVEAFLAFVEVFVLSEERWLSEESDRSNVLSIIERNFPSVDVERLKDGRKNGFAIVQAMRRQDVSTSFLELALYHRSVRRALDDDAFRPFHDMVRGVYQMNKLGRAAAPAQPSASSARGEEGGTPLLSPMQQFRILDCVRDNLDCLFLRLREEPSVLGLAN